MWELCTIFTMFFVILKLVQNLKKRNGKAGLYLMWKNMNAKISLKMSYFVESVMYVIKINWLVILSFIFALVTKLISQKFTF